MVSDLQTTLTTTCSIPFFLLTLMTGFLTSPRLSVTSLLSTGTMDFHPDGTALDSARQVYTATLQDSSIVTWVFNYVSPSKWRLEGEDFYFAGIKESFRMEVVNGKPEAELAQEIIKVVSGSIDYEYKFHLDTLTEKKLQWSFTYRDGHHDTWEFYRTSSRN